MQTLVLKVKHFKNAVYTDPTRCPIANASNDLFPNTHAFEYCVELDVVVTGKLRHIIYRHDPYDYSHYRRDAFYAKLWRLLGMKNKIIRTIELTKIEHGTSI